MAVLLHVVALPFPAEEGQRHRILHRFGEGEQPIERERVAAAVPNLLGPAFAGEQTAQGLRQLPLAGAAERARAAGLVAVGQRETVAPALVIEEDGQPRSCSAVSSMQNRISSSGMRFSR